MSSLKLNQLKFSTPDSDNDSRLDGSVEVTNSADRDIELVVKTVVIFDEAGNIIEGSSNDEDVLIGSGDSLEISMDSSWFKGDLLPSGKGQVEVTIRGCYCDFSDLGAIEFSNAESGPKGLLREIDIAEGLKLKVASLVFLPPDDDGDISVRSYYSVQNSGPGVFPRFKIRSSLKDPRGREIDYGELHKENMLPEDVIADYDSFYTKANRLKGGGKVEYQCTVFQSAFVMTGNESVEVE